MKLKFFMFIFTLLLRNVISEDCNACKCTTKDYLYDCDCTVTICTQNINSNSSKVLVLSENIKIPSNISSKKIQDITLHDMPIKSLSVLQKMVSLKKLTVQSCNINEIEKNTFHNMETLERLTIENNHITDFSEDTFDYIPNLHFINLKNNSIQKFPDKLLKNLTKLAYFSAPLNKIEELNHNLFRNNTKLENIDLNTNKIRELPNDIFIGLSTVEEIDLCNNEIHNLTNGIFSNLNNLKKVNLENNMIISIDASAFKGSSRLKTLNLDGNKIQTMDPNILETLPALNHIQVSFNLCDCKIRTFFSSYKQKGILVNIHCTNPTSLSNKTFSDLSTDDFVCAPRILNCSEEKMDNITKIACKIYGDPVPEINWSLKGTDISTNELYDLNSGPITEDTIWSNLTIFSLSEPTMGSYIIQANNNGGSEKHNYDVINENFSTKKSENMEDQSSAITRAAITITLSLLLVILLSIVILTAIYFIKRNCGTSGYYYVQKTAEP